MANEYGGQLRGLPSVDQLLREERLRGAIGSYSRPIVVEAIREVLRATRDAVAGGGSVPSGSALVDEVLNAAARTAAGTLRPVINATGVIIHTNLGRAPLSEESIAAMKAVCNGYSNLEYDLEAGERGSRYGHVEDLLRRLTGAEAALAVNNNAAAVFLALTALAGEREVVIARGQLVEIGGGFRVPDVMRQSGAKLVEVGTTNRTYTSDYEAAITAETAMLLRVHPSNFRVVGFTREVSLPELVALAGRHDLTVMDDLGSGALLDPAVYGLAREPMVQESVAAGASVVCFSGDKLLGGPQAGIVVGQGPVVERLRRHPLARALRLDKATIAGLQATLLHYLRGEATLKVPVWRMIAAPLSEIGRRADVVVGRLIASGIAARVADTRSTIGGGSLPGEELESRAVSIGSEAGLPPREMAARLRALPLPVVARVEHDALVLDLRTVPPDQDDLIVTAIRQALLPPGP